MSYKKCSLEFDLQKSQIIFLLHSRKNAGELRKKENDRGPFYSDGKISIMGLDFGLSVPVFSL
jgi:hypothetical protein